MPFSRGDVALALFPDSNLRTAKKRPVLVVQRNGLATGVRQAIVAMITSNLSRSGHPSRVTVMKQTPEGQASGLLSDSVVMTDNLATLAESEFDRAIGRVIDMAAVDAALKHTLDL